MSLSTLETRRQILRKKSGISKTNSILQSWFHCFNTLASINCTLKDKPYSLFTLTITKTLLSQLHKDPAVLFKRRIKNPRRVQGANIYIQ